MARRYTKIYEDVRRRTDLTWADKAVYSFILGFTEKDKTCFLRQAKMAEELGISEKTVKRSLKKLLEKGMIRKDGRKGYFMSYSATAESGV